MLPHEMLQTQTQIERSLLSRVMGWLALSLALTAGGVYLWISGVVPQNVPWILYFLVAIGLIFGIQAATSSKNQSLAVGLFTVFSIVEGLFIAPGIFLVAAAVVYLTSINMAAWGRYLLGALLVGIVISFATLIFHFPISQLALSLFLGVVFVGLTFFDFWRVKAERAGDNNALLLALSLYLDFINLFLILLRIFGRRN